ncbi:uncharacterized protein LOC131672513 [Phymastichus coffea]|uniref:uncharacterized protein LOC131672513 n=1 Tax=Phymastichus coffea TaxID=108790 RepID=UPI00273ADF2E|nr:uncharacterized protein LOC131672513 [Phymastichus coffea]
MTTDIFIKHHQISLRVVGAWPTSPLLSVFYFGIGITFFFLVFEIWDIVEIRNNLELLMDNLVSTVGVFLGLCKIATFRWKRRYIKGMIITMSNDWRLESIRSEVMKKNGTRFQRVAIFIIIMDNVVNFTYFLQTVTSYIFDEIPDRKFLARVKFPMDARQSPFYEIIIIGQFITASIHFNAHALVDGFLVTLVLHACSKIAIVKREIANYSKICQRNIDDRESTLSALCRLYCKHLEFIEFSKNIRDIFSLVAFFHISFLTLLQVMSGFMFIDGLERGAKLVDMIHYAVLTITFLITIGFYCICGEYLNNQSKTIFYEFCNCYWYEFSIDNKKAVKFMLFKAQKPMTLTMGKFNDLSLIYFTSIVKTSFSYLSLVRASLFLIGCAHPSEYLMRVVNIEKKKIITFKIDIKIMSLMINKLFELCLKMVGLWPYDFNIIGPLILSSSALTTMPFQVWNAVTMSQNAAVLMDNLSDMLTQVLILIKMFFVWKNKRILDEIMKDLLEDWNSKELPDEWLILARICRTFFTIDISMYLPSCTLYYIDSAFSYFGKPIENRKLLLPSFYPFSYHHSPVFEGIFIIQGIQCTMLIIADVVTQSLLVTLVRNSFTWYIKCLKCSPCFYFILFRQILHVSAQINLLKSNVCIYSNNFKVINGNSTEQLYHIRHVVQQHLKVLRLIEKIDTIYSNVSFFQISFSSLIICVTGYVIVTAMESSDLILLMKFILFIFAMLLQVFSFCFIGQYLQNRGESIISALYSCLWYKAPPNEIKSVMLVLSKAQASLKLTGGRIFQLSINTFVKILKTSVSYLSVLRAVYQ